MQLNLLFFVCAYSLLSFPCNSEDPLPKRPSTLQLPLQQPIAGFTAKVPSRLARSPGSPASPSWLGWKYPIEDEGFLAEQFKKRLAVKLPPDDPKKKTSRVDFDFRDRYQDSDAEWKKFPPIAPLPVWENLGSFKNAGFSNALELFPPQFFSTPPKFATSKPWALDSMVKAVDPLIRSRLLPSIARSLPPAPDGWTREILTESDRPDGFPAVAFAHLADLQRFPVSAKYDSSGNRVIVQVHGTIPSDDPVAFAANLENTLTNYVKGKNRPDKTLFFEMLVRHDILCAQVSINYRPRRESLHPTTKKTTHIARVLFGEISAVAAKKEEEEFEGEERDSWRRPSRPLYGARPFPSIFSSFSFLESGANVGKQFLNDQTPDQDEVSFLDNDEKKVYEVTEELGVTALSFEGQVPIQAAAPDPTDLKYLREITARFGIGPIRGSFPCHESEIVGKPGVADPCIYSPSHNPNKLSPTQTPERVLIQCLARYPTGTWAVYKELTPVPRKRRGHQVVREGTVNVQWRYRKCEKNGWSAPIVDPAGEQKWSTCMSFHSKEF